VLTQLPDGSYLSELLPRQLKKELNKGGKCRVPDEVRIPVRVIEYRITNRDSTETVRLLTTLTDHRESPATPLAALYAERWEFEIGLDEIETHQIANRVMRSKKPELVEQEIWALLLTHYAIRHLMHEAADDVGIDEDRLSFIRSLRVVRRSIVNDTRTFPLPKMTNYIDRPALRYPTARTPSAPSEATHEWSNEPKSATNSSNAATTASSSTPTPRRSRSSEPWPKSAALPSTHTDHGMPRRAGAKPR
jgi:hypothetical protein